jgi:hypothetical protein
MKKPDGHARVRWRFAAAVLAMMPVIGFMRPAERGFNLLAGRIFDAHKF